MSAVLGASPGISSVRPVNPIGAGSLSGSSSPAQSPVRSASLVSQTLVSAPLSNLDPAKILPRLSASSPRLAKADVANMGLEFAGHALASVSVADAAVAINQVGLVDDTGLGADGVATTAYSAVAAAPLAVVDTVLTGLALYKACRDYRQIREGLPEHSAAYNAFEDKRAQYAAGQTKLIELRNEISSIRQHRPNLDALRKAVDDQIQDCRSRRDALVMQRNEKPDVASGPGLSGRLARSFEDSITQVRDLDQILADPELHYLRTQHAALSDDERTSLSSDLKTLDKLAHAEVEQLRLHNELRGLSSEAQQFAEARAAATQAEVTLAEASVGAARSATTLVASGMQAWQGGLELAGQIASEGFQSATNIVGYAAGGLAIVAGGVAIGLAAYRTHKAQQSKQAIEAALAASKDKSPDKLIDEVAAHAIARRETTRSQSIIDIVKNSLSVTGGVLGLIALSATGLGALVLGAAALGLGLTVACTSVGQLIYNRRGGRLDNALRAQVADELSRAALIDQTKTAIRQALTASGQAVVTDAEIEAAAQRIISASNPFYALHLLAQRLNGPADSAEHRQTLEFLRDSGMPDDALTRLKLLLSDGSSNEDKATGLAMLQAHILA